MTDLLEDKIMGILDFINQKRLKCLGTCLVWQEIAKPGNGI